MRRQPPRDDRPEPAKRQQRNNLRMTLRLLVVLYLIWLVYQLIQGYRTGESGMPVEVLVAAVAIFLAAAGGIGVISYRRWKREDTRVGALWAEEGEREREAGEEGSDHDE